MAETLDLPRLLQDAAAQVSDLLDQYLAAVCRLSVVQWRLLAAIDERGVTSAAEIGEATGMDKVKVSRALTALIDKRLVRRWDGPNNKRPFQMQTTKRGAAVVERSRSVIPDLEADLATRLNAAEMQALRAALVRLQECGERVEEAA